MRTCGRPVVRLFISITCGIAIAAAAGCGGGGGAGGSSGGGPSISAESRQAVFTAVGQKMASLSLSSRTAYAQAMADFLKTRPEFASSGISKDGNIYGVFTDGRWFTIYNNRPDPDPGPAVPYEPYDVDDGLSRAPTEIPTGKTFRIINYFNRVEMTTLLQQMASKRGYAPTPGGATLKDFRNVRNAGALMLNTHGGETLYKDNSVHFGMMTSTLKDLNAEKTDATLADDLDKNRIGYAADPDEVDKYHKAGKPDSDIPIHYAIGAGFASKYWTFASNSFAYAAVCESADTEFTEACFGKNLSHWAGWTNSVTTVVAERNAKFLFDRLIGANAYDTADQNRRPFTIDKVVEELIAKNYSIDTGVSPNAIFTLLPNSSAANFGLFDPSIKYMEVDDYHNKLTIHGDFGSDQGASKRDVKINGQSVNDQVTSWATDQIVLNLASDENAPTFAGPVVVSVRGHDSNIVPITKFKGTIHYELLGKGTLKESQDATLLFRADVHRWREKPGDDPTGAPFHAITTKSSKCSYANSGSYHDPDLDLTTTWSGGADLAQLVYQGSGTNVNWFSCSGNVDPKKRTIRLYFYWVAATGLKWKTVDGGGGSDSGADTETPELDVFDGSDPATGGTYFDLTYDSSFTIDPINRTKTIADPLALNAGPNATAKVTVNFTAQYPPDTNKGEDDR